MSSLEVLASHARNSGDLPVDLFGTPAPDGSPSARMEGLLPSQAHALRLARDLHDTVAQRLCGVALILGSVWPSASAVENQALCRSEITDALEELHRLIECSLGQNDMSAGGNAAIELARLRAEHAPNVGLSCPRVPAALALSDEIRVLLDATLAEGLRNARKHARPRAVSIAVTISGQTVRLDVENDGVASSNAMSLGLGIRLLEMEASLRGGALECGPRRSSSWRMRLTVPLEAHP